MIQKQELRIGNSVIYKGEVWKVEELSDTAAHLSRNHLLVRGHYDNIYPIPITEEALKDMGFLKQMSWTYCKQIKGNKKLIYYLGEKGWSIGNKNYSDFDCKYIHQLQNIFYFLTQTELSYD